MEELKELNDEVTGRYENRTLRPGMYSVIKSVEGRYLDLYDVQVRKAFGGNRRVHNMGENIIVEIKITKNEFS